MQKLILPLLALITALASCGPAQEKAPEVTVPAPAEENWIPLFNGKDLTGWDIKMNGHAVGENPRNTFVWEDGMLRIKYDEYDTFDELYGHMHYQTPYSHYKLRFDYRFTGEQTTGGAVWNVRNSGVMLHGQSAASNELGQHFPVSVELQLLGGLSDGKTRTTGNVCTPGTTVMMGDTLNNHHCISSSSKTYDGDQWVHAEAVVLGGEAMHFLIEGDTILSFQNPQIGGGTAKQLRNWGLDRDAEMWADRAGEILTTGYISLQAESHPIDFKNVELMELPTEE